MPRRNISIQKIKGCEHMNMSCISNLPFDILQRINHVSLFIRTEIRDCEIITETELNKQETEGGRGGEGEGEGQTQRRGEESEQKKKTQTGHDDRIMF